jgi:AraC-like DNA-binding protein
MNQLGFASVAAVAQYLRYAQCAGIAPAAVLGPAGLTPAALEPSAGRITGAQFQSVIRALLELSGDPVLGLRSGDHVQPGSYSVLGYITMSCETLGEAVERIARYEKLVGDMGVTTREVTPEAVRLSWHCGYSDPAVRAHMVDNVFASWINYARWLADLPSAGPLRVELEHPSPGSEWEAEYAARWQCPVLFEQAASCLVLDPAVLDLRLRQPDALLRKALEEHALIQLAVLDDDAALVTRVRNAIRQQLRLGITRQDMIAEQLGLTPRTLQRKLSQERISYQELLSEVRLEMAADYLRDTSLPIEEIALRLGYSEVRSFYRSFKSATGKTPGDYRSREPRLIPR